MKINSVADQLIRCSYQMNYKHQWLIVKNDDYNCGINVLV